MIKYISDLSGKELQAVVEVGHLGVHLIPGGGGGRGDWGALAEKALKGAKHIGQDEADQLEAKYDEMLAEMQDSYVRYVESLKNRG